MTGGGELERFGMGRVVGECRAGDGRGPGHGQKLLSGYARAVHEKRARGQWTLDVSPKTHFPVRIYGFTQRLSERFGPLIYEFAKFGVIGVSGLFITNAVYGLLFIHLDVGPVASTTVATIVAAVATYLGNRHWSFRARQRTRVVRELIIFAVLNGVGVLIQDAAVAFNSYLLQLGHNKLAGFIALNSGIALATLFRFWSYRRSSGSHRPPTQLGTPTAGHGQRAARHQQRPLQVAKAQTGIPGDGSACAPMCPMVRYPAMQIW